MQGSGYLPANEPFFPTPFANGDAAYSNTSKYPISIRIWRTSTRRYALATHTARDIDLAPAIQTSGAGADDAELRNALSRPEPLTENIAAIVPSKE